MDAGPWFAIGSASTFAAPASGRLYLAMNDIVDTYGDNSGALRITISSP